jgi:hypothetical protein
MRLGRPSGWVEGYNEPPAVPTPSGGSFYCKINAEGNMRRDGDRIILTPDEAWDMTCDIEIPVSEVVDTLASLRVLADAYTDGADELYFDDETDEGGHGRILTMLATSVLEKTIQLQSLL